MTTTGHVAKHHLRAQQADSAGLVNGREARQWEADILARAREAARLAECAALFTGVHTQVHTYTEDKTNASTV